MKEFLIGILIGIANSIPGVSGGTIAVSFNVFDRLIAFISRFRTRLKEDLKFILCLGFGVVVGVLASAKLIVFLIENYPVDVGFFFLGVILGSVPLIYEKAAKPEFKPLSIIPFALCFGFMIFMWLVKPPEAISTELTGSPLVNFFMMMLYGAIGAACMIIPGISGSFVLTLVGGYGKVMGAVANHNFLMLAALAIGCIIGIIGCAKIINRIIYKYGNYTYSGILGFVLGSLFVVYPGYSFGENGIIPIIALAAGFAITFMFNIKDKKSESK